MTALPKTIPPNLYSFATKELAQDATIAYILAWADPVYRNRYPHLHELGAALLRALLKTQLDDSEIPAVQSLVVEAQIKHVDVLVRINGNDPDDGLILLIEDKIDTHEHSDQINTYIKEVKKPHPDTPVVAVYLKTGNASVADLPDPSKCGRFLRQDLLGILDRFPDTSDTIIDNFRSHLQRWEDETNGFSNKPLGEWDGDQKWCLLIQGLYLELERRMRMDDRHSWGNPEWSYVSNPAGGFWYFAFQFTLPFRQPIKEEVIQIDVYLQIEDATRLTLRLGIRDGNNKVNSELMYKALELAEETAAGKYPFNIRKAGRFRGGSSAAVAEITFGDEGGYLALDKNGIIDMDQTIDRLEMAGKFVEKMAGHVGYELAG